MVVLLKLQTNLKRVQFFAFIYLIEEKELSDQDTHNESLKKSVIESIMRKYMHKESEGKELDPLDEHPQTLLFKNEEPTKIDSGSKSNETKEKEQVESNISKTLNEIIDKALANTPKKPQKSFSKYLEKYIEPEKSKEVLITLQKEIEIEKQIQAEIKQSIETKSKSLKKARTELIENQKKLDLVIETEIKNFENNRLELIGKMSSKMAHDIRNPLSVLKMQVDLMKLKQKKQEDEIMSSSITRMDKAISDITNQINDVLTFIRQPNLELISCDLKDIINNSIEQLQIPDKVTITQSVDSRMIRCDMTKIKGIITNILHNGIQAINGEGEISIVVEENEKTIDIKITDSGPGIPENIMDKIFEPMFTTKALGTGLGLASCVQFLDMHGGTIKVKNNPTTFTITLPKIHPSTI
jgi:signal transduction histidine kinase